MEYRIILNLAGDGELAKALRERVESPDLGTASAFFHQGVSYTINIEGVSVKFKTYMTEIPDAYADMVKKVVLKAHLAPGERAPKGTYVREQTTASVDAFSSGNDNTYVVVVEGPLLGRVNRLFNDIRTGKADKAHRAKWGTTPAESQQ